SLKYTIIFLLILSIIINPLFLVLSVSIIIILVYINSDMQLKENFDINFNMNTPPIVNYKSCQQSKSWISNETPLETGDYFVSKNQNLVGRRQNPKTYIAPLIVPPSHDIEYWKKNEFTKYPSVMNRPRQQDLYLSGYVSKTNEDVSNKQQYTMTSY